MGTEVLRPQDCLIERIRIAQPVFQHHRRKNNGNPNPSRKPAVRPEQKKNKPLASSRSASLDDLRKSHNHNNYHHNNLVMGQVMILRRGESLDSKINGHRQPAKKASDDLIVPKQIRIGDLKSVSGDVYAGSAISLSPSPRSLPLPSFFSKKQVSKIAAVEDCATRDLRRLLRLD